MPFASFSRTRKRTAHQYIKQKRGEKKPRSVTELKGLQPALLQKQVFFNQGLGLRLALDM